MHLEILSCFAMSTEFEIETLVKMRGHIAKLNKLAILYASLHFCHRLTKKSMLFTKKQF